MSDPSLEYEHASKSIGREETVREALHTYPSDPSRLHDNEIEVGIAELQRIVQAAEAKKLAWLAEVQRRASFRRDGYLSATDWLSERFNLTHGSAKQEVKALEALEAAPEVRDALQAGEVSPSAVRVLTAAWESHPDAFEASGSSLLEEAKTKPIGDLRRTVEDWRHRQDQDGGLEEARKARERRGADIAPSASRMVRMSADFDPEGGGYVMTARPGWIQRSRRGGWAFGRPGSSARTPW